MPHPAPDYIKGYEKVLAAYGFWPDFHDAPARLTRVSEDRIDLEVKALPLPLGISAESHPYYRYRTVFSFTGILSDKAQPFGTSNIIFDLTFSSAEDLAQNGSFIVDLDSAMGCDLCGHLRAKKGEVLLVEDVLSRNPAAEQ